MKLPSDEDLRRLGPQVLSNEIEVQRFVEDHVLARLGLRPVCSSVGGRGRLEFMDTVAIDEDANPVIVEYQWDMVDGRALGQVFGTTTGFSAAAVGSTRELRPVMALRSWSIGDDLA